MRIKSLQLENIRSHTKTALPFMRGFNCLVGGLGRGKSSVLYALDFVLFGDPLGRSYEYLLREGANKGKATAVFVHGKNTYTLHRALRRHGKSISQDMEQLKLYEKDKLIAGMKNEAVAEQLRTLTGLDKNLFREVVWIRQEHLKELLDITPRRRQRKLDQLFGLSDYEVAWSTLAQFQREYNVEKEVYERDADIIGANNLQAEYNRTVEDFFTAETQLQHYNKELTKTESTLKEAASSLENLEELRKKTEELRRTETQLKTNIVNIKDKSARLGDQIAAKKRRIHTLEEQSRMMETQEKSHRNRLQEVEIASNETTKGLKENLLAAEEKRRSIVSEQDVTKSEVEASQKRISSLTTENKCPLCLQNLTGDYKNNLLERLRRRNIQCERKLLGLQKSLDELEGLHSIVDLVLSNLQKLIPRIEDIKRRTIEEQDSLRKLLAEFEDVQEEETKLQGQLSSVRAEIAKFDITMLESTRKRRDNAFNRYSNIKHKLENLKTRKKDITLKIDDLKNRLDKVQEKIERKQRIGNLLEIIDSIRGAYRSIQPKLRREFVTYLEQTVQQQIDNLIGDTGPVLIVKIDETYTPFVSSEEGYVREVLNLSGGERTLVAFAYRIGLGQLIMQSRTGHGLYMLLLDEPTESLGSEDGSVARLAEAISRLKAIEQIIAVTHSEAFAEKAEHIIRVEKEAETSKVILER